MSKFNTLKVYDFKNFNMKKKVKETIAIILWIICTLIAMGLLVYALKLIF